MYEGPPRSRAQTEYRRRKPPSALTRRPDRIALWAVAMAVIAMVAAATSAHAGSGGTTTARSGSGGSASCPDSRFGARALKLGDCGSDVKTLHWLLKAATYTVPLDKDFDSPTDNSVRSFQRRHSLNTDGVVRRHTRRKIVKTMPKSVATWYGPGFFGKQTACGKTLHRGTLGVAHRHLPCGTRVTLKYHSHYVRARVIDRGPYTSGVRWDLTQGTAEALHFTTTDNIRAAPIK
jgi:peptidoglycan hydrolase-like protein with peptidoglycan-binding domain